ncbi:Protein SIEVE ELEMENT OCCLUSION B [Linum perenne]
MAFRGLPPPTSHVPSKQLLMRGGEHQGSNMMMMSDENVMMKQIVATHLPDGREVDVRPLLVLVEDILNRATLQVDTIHTPTQVRTEIGDKANQINQVTMMEALSYTIDRVSKEIAYKTLGGADGHSTTVMILESLASFPWDAKLVLTLASFALHYGEFWLLAQIYPSNQLAKAMATLRQLPLIMEHSGPLKPRFDALNKLIKAMLEVTRCLVQFKELPPTYISADVPALSTALTHVPTAVYWTIRSIVASANQITLITTMGHEYALSTTEAWELSSLEHKLNNICDHLRKQLGSCYHHIDDRKNAEAFNMLVDLFEMTHIDNMKILKALIHAKDDLMPIVDGSTKRKVSLEVLRRKNVLLLISDLNISQDELSILEQIYSESRLHMTRMESQYEVIWIPVMDTSIQWTEAMHKQYENLQSTMPWYTVSHPSLIEKAVIRFIREKWHFRNKAILVVLDPQGRVLSPNAIHMMWIWGSNAFPFTSSREESLWRDETLKLELLVNGIDPMILNWVKEGKYIFLYGGGDVEWVRKFTNTARAVAVASRIPLEMAYVGKSTKKELVRRVIATITIEKLSYFWQDPTMIWFFWTRLESMLFSKIQLGRNDDHDPMMLEIKKLLSYDKEGGWAVLSKGSNIISNGHGNTVLTTLVEYDLWKEHIPVKGFDLAYDDHHKKVHGVTYPCCRFEFPNTAGRIPETMKCPECHRHMEKYTTFLCCHDEGHPSSSPF